MVLRSARTRLSNSNWPAGYGGRFSDTAAFRRATRRRPLLLPSLVQFAGKPSDVREALAIWKDDYNTAAMRQKLCINAGWLAPQYC